MSRKKKRPGPKPIDLPADAVAELLRMADALDRDARGWSPKNASPNMRRWLEGVRCGLGDAAKSIRRRAARVRKAQETAFAGYE